MVDPLRIGLLGTGGLGTHIGRFATEAAGATLAAIADISDDNRRRAGDELGVPADRRYDDYAAMLDGTALDAVMIATPHTLHYDQVIEALNRDLHVLCEKPLTTDLEDARSLVERSECGSPVLQVGYQRHIEAPYVAARERLAAFGSIDFITASITQDWYDNHGHTWRGNPDLSGGGQLYDTGSHIVDFVLWATGLTPTSVSASMVYGDDARRVDVQAALTVAFAEDAVATIAVSGDTPQVREQHRFWGDDGAVYVDGVGWDGRTVRTIDADGTEDDSPGVEADLPTNKVVAFIDAVREGTVPPATARHAYNTTAVTEAAYESARTGERIEIEPI